MKLALDLFLHQRHAAKNSVLVFVRFLLNSTRRKKLPKDDRDYDFGHVGQLKVMRRLTFNVLQKNIFYYGVCSLYLEFIQHANIIKFPLQNLRMFF